MGLIYQVRNQIAYRIIANGMMNVITPQIDKDFHHDMSQADAVHHGQYLYRLRRLHDEGYGPTPGFFADRQR